MIGDMRRGTDSSELVAVVLSSPVIQSVGHSANHTNLIAARSVERFHDVTGRTKAYQRL